MSSSSSITVVVEPRFLPEQSAPHDRVYAFAYVVTVTNLGKVPAQLISRHWKIQDAGGRLQEVKGLGVVGQQPLIPPGEAFRYTSGCRLQAGTGSMQGSFFFVTETGERFDVPIPVFVLDAGAGEEPPVPRVLH
ncbi:Co2+/Mg2+ efflux protein ApaG [Variovorax sp.]|uniref:Co2+/Mg2+ efflux protein ApaG n=1 Tax=Variovorax sp. TaxID=1871043 RepID=UPI002D4D3CD9|nr:Co2+/Mg2+ efflux protein ApaG [Variovorax sp.]HYP84196.1 Co2+/Mg2+ efflux protein ApaG [Variovorax sp.]